MERNEKRKNEFIVGMIKMEKTIKKQIVIIIIASILLIGIGFISGFYTKVLIEKNKIINEKEKQTSISKLMSRNEIEQLKEKIVKDEEDYGNSYKDFKAQYPYVYKKDPDRIYFKSSKVGTFYVFEKNDENYKHLLEVAEDRMLYSANDDYNLRCITPESIDEMKKSGNNYIIFDYDNKDLFDSDYNRDIILKFNENTRLYRLITYLSYYKEPILKKDLPKKEFADKIGITGYQYMTYPEGD